MITLVAILALFSTSAGDFRVRAEHSWPEPVGILDNLWQGSALSFYQRLRFDYGQWSTVVFTEKDPGEEWGDLISGGIGWDASANFKAVAGALRVQFSHGLLLSHPGSWSAGDPLALSKTPSFRMRLDLSESPGGNDAEPLTGAAAEYNLNSLTISTVLGWSKTDTGSSGLHRTESELENRRAVEEKMAALRLGVGPAGISAVHMVSTEETSEESVTRIGADFQLQAEDAVFTGEVAADLDSTFNFLLSGSRGQSDFRHALSVSRFTGNWPRSGAESGTSHRIGAGYGLNWRPSDRVTLDAGLQILDTYEENQWKLGLQLSERIAPRTSLSQRFKLTASEEERTYRIQASSTWSPYSDLTLTIKIPFTIFQNSANPDENENGTGLEIRLKHSPVASVDLTVSAAAASTNGWNSRIYAYSLSFPGEFGSTALYNSSTLLQGAVSLHISERASLRLKGSFYNMEGAESCGSGSSETAGSSRTSAGMQLDWDF